MSFDKTPYIKKIKNYNKQTKETIYTDYLSAPGRILWFNSDRDNKSRNLGFSEPELLYITDQLAVVRVAIHDLDTGMVISGGLGSCTLANSTKGRYVEQAETAARARALGLLGYGTDDDDEDHLADSPTEIFQPISDTRRNRMILLFSELGKPTNRIN